MIIEVQTCPKCGVATESHIEEDPMAEEFRVREGGKRFVHVQFEEVCWPCDPVAQEVARENARIGEEYEASSAIHRNPWPDPFAADDDDDLEDDLPF
tara:strand:- start:299 stop:589 length:291 start_codon:yes stop_codon:yes gene_type:complete